MTLDILIEILTDYRDKFGGDAEVRLTLRLISTITGIVTPQKYKFPSGTQTCLPMELARRSLIVCCTIVRFYAA